MAEKPVKTKRKLRKTPTIREQANDAKNQAQPVEKKRRIRKSVKTVTKPLVFISRFIIPSYFRNSFKELRDVKWPDRKQTTQLTIAVFIFATIFGVIIAVTDYGLDKIFKKVLLR